MSLYVLCFSSCSCSLSSHKKNICSEKTSCYLFYSLFVVAGCIQVWSCLQPNWCYLGDGQHHSKELILTVSALSMHFLQKTWPNKIQIFKFLQIRALLQHIFQKFSTTPKLTRPHPLTDDWLVASELHIECSSCGAQVPRSVQRRAKQCHWMYLVCILCLNVHFLAILVDFILHLVS